MSGDAWRYAPSLNDPQAAAELLHAALSAPATIRFARTKVNPDEFGTAPDWRKVERDLTGACGRGAPGRRGARLNRFRCA